MSILFALNKSKLVLSFAAKSAQLKCNKAMPTDGDKVARGRQRDCPHCPLIWLDVTHGIWHRLFHIKSILLSHRSRTYHFIVRIVGVLANVIKLAPVSESESEYGEGLPHGNARH